MALKTYRGSCHCGAVRFETDIDLGEGTNKCNCSICTKARAWFVIVKPDKLRQLTGFEAQTEYTWVPPGRLQSVLHYQFCSACGVRTFGWGNLESFGGKFYFVSMAALDDVDRDELAQTPVTYSDGRHDRFGQQPADTRLL